ncbi:MAG: hypothetical protein O4804_05680 [Trichodesmium sp. St11_bin5]|nr:hypothetical protein [Trichodesmium sp. St11_bin5]
MIYYEYKDLFDHTHDYLFNKKNNICAIALDENQLKQEIKKILKIDKLKIVH